MQDWRNLPDEETPAGTVSHRLAQMGGNPICPTCNGTGSYTYKDRLFSYLNEGDEIQTTGPCPRCIGTDGEIASLRYTAFLVGKLAGLKAATDEIDKYLGTVPGMKMTAG